MINIFRLTLLFFLSWFFFSAVISCNPVRDSEEKKMTELPVNSDGYLSPFLCSVEEVLDLAEQKDQYTFRYIENGQPGKKEFSRISISGNEQKSRYRHLEIYSTYENPQGGKEYYAVEFEIEPSDTLLRKPLNEFQVVHLADTAYRSVHTPTDILLEKIVSVSHEDQDYPLFKILGFAHKGDAEPAHHRYWSPQLGTVLLWFGENYAFELMSGPNPKDQTLLNLLKSRALEMEE